MNVSPAGSGNITSPEFDTPVAEYPASFTCSITYNLTAVPNAADGYEFVDWAVNASTETDNPLTVDVTDGAKAITAFFRIAGALNNAPTADAGADRPVSEGALVTLDGSGSSDPNGDGDIRSYLWEQTAGAETTLSNASAVKPTFTAPAVDGATGPITVTFQLTVTDILGETDTDSVTITVEDSGNDPPTANAGLDQTVAEGDLVELDGSGSSDPNGFDDLQTFLWEQTEGTEVTLSNTLLAQPTFTAPDVEVTEDPMTLIFKLIVTDFAGLTSEDLVTIKVKRGPIGGDSSAGCFVSGTVR